MRIRRRTWPISVSALVLSIGVVIVFWPRHWEVTAADGSSLCTVVKGASQADVIRVCGAPLREGGQPKLWQGWSTMCSAPCELRGNHFVFYDCNDVVWKVAAASSAWQGCVLETEQSRQR